MTKEEALNNLKNALENSNIPIKETLLDSFYLLHPELKENEDERIRKALLRCCDDWEKGQFGCMAKEDVPAIRAYLEKQKEQKPELPLMNGDADLYLDEWKQHYQGSPTKRKCFEEGMRYAQRLQKQPEVDLEDEISRFIRTYFSKPDYDKDFIAEVDWEESMKECARHFYELGLNARKE